MKVVQINAVCGPGTSTGRATSELSDFLTAKGIENKIFYGNGSCDRKNSEFIGSKFDHKVHAFLSRLTGLQGYFSYNATKKMLKKLDEFSPDVIHLGNLHGNYICLPLLFKYIIKKQIATVITLHDCFLYTGKCVHYIDASCDKWQKECGNCPQLKNGNPSWFFDRTKKMLKDKKKWYSGISRLGVAGVSKWVTDECRKSVLSENAVFKAIYNWIDVDVFKPHESDVREKIGIDKDKFVILGVSGSWSKEKGIDDFNHLAEMLTEEFQIVLVGKTNGNINEKIISIPPTKDMNLLSDIYATADVFFNPTKRETFGKVTAEAISSGVPAIVYNTTACPELVGEGCGFVENVGDINAVYRDILKMRSENISYAEACRNFALANFAKEKLLNDNLEFYKMLLEK